jgi:hypothetical protein
MAYRIPMTSRHQRVGPDGNDLRRTQALDEASTKTLIGAGLAVVRVNVDQLSGAATIVWRNRPSQEAKAEAEALIGPAQHTV